MLLATGALMLVGYLLVQYLALPAIGYALLFLSLVLMVPASHGHTPRELARNAATGVGLGAMLLLVAPTPLALFVMALGLVPFGYYRYIA